MSQCPGASCTARSRDKASTGFQPVTDQITPWNVLVEQPAPWKVSLPRERDEVWDPSQSHPSVILSQSSSSSRPAQPGSISWSRNTQPLCPNPSRDPLQPSGAPCWKRGEFYGHVPRAQSAAPNCNEFLKARPDLYLSVLIELITPLIEVRICPSGIHKNSTRLHSRTKCPWTRTGAGLGAGTGNEDPGSATSRDQSIN